MNIAVIDAEIVGKNKHRFPNLCCMKISAYHKSLGDSVVLKTDYDSLEKYDKVYISKVFTATEIPGEYNKEKKSDCNKIAEYYADNQFLKQPNIVYGGTGFFYNKAPALPPEIEHMKPDYHLYDEWVEAAIAAGYKRSEFTYYLDYSIGYLTRKCFRGCYYCVNRDYKKVEPASPLEEFLDQSRPKICFWDDNFLGYPRWKELIEPVIESGKRFQFRQGLDERLLTKEKILEISKWKYDGEMIFAFDNIEDKDLIISKLSLIRETAPNWNRGLRFYVFCGCDKNDVYDEDFWHKDIENMFERIRILSKFKTKPYIMRFERVYRSEYSTFYATVAAWCNQPAMFKSYDFNLFSKVRGMNPDGYKKFRFDTDAYLDAGFKKGAAWKSVEEVAEKFPEIADKYFHFIGWSNCEQNNLN